MKVTAALLISLLLLSPDLRAADAPTARGKYKEWGPNIDSIEIVSTFDAEKYDTIAIGNFTTGATPRPKKSDNAYDAVVKTLSTVESTLAAGAKKASKKKVITGSGKKGTLVVRGRVVELDPGSRAGRYWSGGLGGGAAAATISGEIIDGQSGKVLVRFTQRRKSGGGMRIGGGNYTQVLNACVRAIGEDIANIVDEF